MSMSSEGEVLGGSEVAPELTPLERDMRAVLSVLPIEMQERVLELGPMNAWWLLSDLFDELDEANDSSIPPELREKIMADVVATIVRHQDPELKLQLDSERAQKLLADTSKMTEADWEWAARRMDDELSNP